MCITRILQKEPWQIAAARFCVKNAEAGFNFEQLMEYIKFNYPSVKETHISQFFEEEIQSPPGRGYSRTMRGDKWIPSLELVSQITDFDELQEARESSKNAMYIAIGSLIIATVVGIAQIYVQICYK